ncbi:MAG: flotillin [Planctomycetota bacterium]|jgi:flotillin
MDTAQIIGLSIGLGTILVLLLIVFIKSNVILCQPNEILILAGRTRKRPDGSTVGYRVIRGGRGFKMPMVESVARLSLTSQAISIKVTNAMCAGMIPVNVEGRANIKLAGSSELGMDAAIERFLGKGDDAVAKSANQAIEGVLRGVIAKMSPEEANADRLTVSSAVTERSREVLHELGIVLDFFQVQDIGDEGGYLEAIGRQRNAEVQRDALVAEATADAEARTVAAQQKCVAITAEIAAKQAVIGEENDLAVRQAELESKANQARERAEVAGQIARVEEEILLEEKRIDLSAKKCEAETVIPARASRDAHIMEAEGRSARIREEGKATAKSIELLGEQWQKQDDAKDLFLLEMMPRLLDKVTRVMADNLRIDKLTIIDGGDGQALPGHVKSLASSAISMLEQLKTATGIDVARIAKKAEKSDEGILPKDLS